MCSSTNQNSIFNAETTCFYHKKFNLEQEGNLVYVVFHSEIYLEVQDTQDMYDILVNISQKEGKKLNLLLNVNGVIGTNKASRDLGVSPIAIQVTNSLTLITKSVISRAMANFFMKVTPPPYPIQIVNNLEKEIEWLHRHLQT